MDELEYIHITKRANEARNRVGLITWCRQGNQLILGEIVEQGADTLKLLVIDRNEIKVMKVARDV